MDTKTCRCGGTIYRHSIIGSFDKLCAVCKLLSNFHNSWCVIFEGKEACTCGTGLQLEGIVPKGYVFPK